IAPEVWSYIAAGQYLWEYPRGSEGGLPPLHQFASSLSGTRYMAYTLLGFLSPLVRPGDTQAVSALLQAWTLFIMTCAIALFWVAIRQRTWIIVTATVLSTVAGWITDLIWINNLDNGLALVYMPALASVVSLLAPRQPRWWLLLGCFLAGILYTYPE